jgi:hypothetical protein
LEPRYRKQQENGENYVYKFIPLICKFVMATIECGISHKDTKCKINAATTTQKQNNETTNTFSKYCKY